MPQDQALAELSTNAGSQFDPHVVEALLGVLGEEEEGPGRAEDGREPILRPEPG